MNILPTFCVGLIIASVVFSAQIDGSESKQSGHIDWEDLELAENALALGDHRLYRRMFKSRRSRVSNDVSGIVKRTTQKRNRNSINQLLALRLETQSFQKEDATITNTQKRKARRTRATHLGWNETCTTSQQCQKPFVCLPTTLTCRCKQGQLFSVKKDKCSSEKAWFPTIFTMYAESPVAIRVSWTMKNFAQRHDIGNFQLKYWTTEGSVKTIDISPTKKSRKYDKKVVELKSNTTYTFQLVIQLKNGLAVESKQKDASTVPLSRVQSVREGPATHGRRSFLLTFSKGCTQGAIMDIEGTNHTSTRNISLVENGWPKCFDLKKENPVAVETQENEIPKGDNVTARFRSYFGTEGLSDTKTSFMFTSCFGLVEGFEAVSWNTTSIEVKWNKPIGGVDNFSIDVSAQSRIYLDADKTSYVIDQLRADTSYNITIIANRGECVSSPTTISQTTLMKRVSNFQATSPEIGTVKATGDFRNNSLYLQTITCQDDVVHYKTGNYYESNVFRLPGGCCNASVAGVNAGGVGPLTSQTVTVQTQAPGQPRDVNVSVSSDAMTAKVTWTSPDQWTSNPAHTYKTVTYNDTAVTAYSIDLFNYDDRNQAVLINSTILKCSGLKCPHPCENQDEFPVQTFQYGQTTFETNFSISSYTKYTIDVRAQSTTGGWGEGKSYTFHTPSTQAPGSAVRDVIVLRASTNSVTLSWKKPLKPNGEITAYRLNWTYYETQCDDLLKEPVVKENTEVFVSTWETTSYTVANLKPYTRYTFTLAAINEPFGESSFWSEPVIVTTKDTRPLPVRNVQVSPRTTWCTIYWEAPCPVQGLINDYAIRVSGPLNKTYTTTDTVYNMTGLETNNNYSVTVLARGSEGDSPGTSVTFSTPYSVMLIADTGNHGMGVDITTVTYITSLALMVLVLL